MFELVRWNKSYSAMGSNHKSHIFIEKQNAQKKAQWQYFLARNEYFALLRIAAWQVKWIETINGI